MKDCQKCQNAVLEPIAIYGRTFDFAPGGLFPSKVYWYGSVAGVDFITKSPSSDGCKSGQQVFFRWVSGGKKGTVSAYYWWSWGTYA
jgi:hypothetical protein